jgi:hypothetical protein
LYLKNESGPVAMMTPDTSLLASGGVLDSFVLFSPVAVLTGVAGGLVGRRWPRS